MVAQELLYFGAGALFTWGVSNISRYVIARRHVKSMNTSQVESAIDFYSSLDKILFAGKYLAYKQEFKSRIPSV